MVCGWSRKLIPYKLLSICTLVHVNKNFSDVGSFYFSRSVYIYSTSIVAKYLDSATMKTSTKFYKNTFPYDMIFTKSDASTSDEQIDKLTRGFNVHYRAFIG